MLERGLADRIFQPSVHRAAFRPAMWTQWWHPGVRCAHMKYLICSAPKCGQTTCKQAWRAASPEIRCPSATHMHRHTRLCIGTVPANVPTHDKPVGLQMLTHKCVQQNILRTWKHSKLCGRRDLYKSIFPAYDTEHIRRLRRALFSLESFLLDTSLVSV